jgi:AcrR family transcriptional regulator
MTTKEPREKRIQAIIEAAVQVFLEKGYEGTSMESIAKRSGLTKGGLYHHFKSKDEILQYVNHRFREPVLEMMETCRRSRSPTKGLRKFIRDYLGHWDRHADQAAFTFLSMVKVISSRELWPIMEAYASEMASFFESMLDLGVAAGELRSHDVQSRSWTLVASLDGVIGYMIMSAALTPRSTAASLEKVLLDEILAQGDKGRGKNA